MPRSAGRVSHKNVIQPTSDCDPDRQSWFADFIESKLWSGPSVAAHAGCDAYCSCVLKIIASADSARSTSTVSLATMDSTGWLVPEQSCQCRVGSGSWTRRH